MLRVYLDQNKWIELSRARVGKKNGEAFVDVWEIAREASARGWVSFPLSLYHYMENSHRRDYKSRQELAATQRELSRGHGIAPPTTLVEYEAEHALHLFCGRPVSPRPVRPFGKGPAHVFPRLEGKYRPPATLPAELHHLVRGMYDELLANVLLAGVPPGVVVPGLDLDAHRAVGKQFAARQEERREQRCEEGVHYGHDGRMGVSLETALEYEQSLGRALESAGLNWDFVKAGGLERIDQFISAVPTSDTHRALRQLRHQAVSKTWEENDLVDLTALPVALVHCDVVVTEKQWTHLIRREKLGERFGTTVIHNLNDLVPHLLGAPVA